MSREYQGLRCVQYEFDCSRRLQQRQPLYLHRLLKSITIVLRVLKEPIQSTLHAILQQNVPKGTKCIIEGCTGSLNKKGKCTGKCTQSGVNVVKDIMDCINCDSYFLTF